MVLRFSRAFLGICLFMLLTGCRTQDNSSIQVAATTGPVAQFAAAIVQGSEIHVSQLITDSVSCVHDYSLSVRQMELLEGSDLVLISGAGLEETMEDVLPPAEKIADCSDGVELLEMVCHRDHEHDHGQQYDPHIWLSPGNAAKMAENICEAMTALVPEQADLFRRNTDLLQTRLEELRKLGKQELQDISCRRLITFHDGFSYLAQAFELEILEAMEEESGSEISAAVLTHTVELVREYEIPAVFTEVNGSGTAASVLSAETGVSCFALDLAMGGSDYFDAMDHNIKTLKEALQ